jgi:4-alpha-glucanotransferase
MGPTGYGNSPYQALSSFAGNELLISPAGLIEDGLLQASDCEAHSFAASRIDYGAVIPYKRRMLIPVPTTIPRRASGTTNCRPGSGNFFGPI